MKLLRAAILFSLCIVTVKETLASRFLGCSTVAAKLIKSHPDQAVETIVSRDILIEGMRVRFKDGVGIESQRRVTKSQAELAIGLDRPSKLLRPNLLPKRHRLVRLPKTADLTAVLRKTEGKYYIDFTERYFPFEPEAQDEKSESNFGYIPFELKFSAPVVFERGSYADYMDNKNVRFALTDEGAILAAKAHIDAVFLRERGKFYDSVGRRIFPSPQTPQFAARMQALETTFLSNLASRFGPSGDDLISVSIDLGSGIAADREARNHLWVSHAPDKIPISFVGSKKDLIMQFPDEIRLKIYNLEFESQN